MHALFVVLMLAATIERADPVDVTFRVTVPEDTPADAEVFIAGDFQGWNPGSDAHRLTRVAEHVYEIALALEVGASIEYKFTRGDWSRVEKGRQGDELPNRKLTVAGSTVVKHVVGNWRDMSSENAPPRRSTITGNVSLITVPGFLGDRRVWIYLPPGYEGSDERYPVLYMLDGQNVFDEATSFAGEWRVDEACERLIAANEMRPIIVVAVANGELKRTDEYTPWYDPGYKGGAGGAGEAHLRAFLDVLLPHVNVNYRTLTGPENTGFSGSSLGGLMSTYVAYVHPDTFGLIAAVSPYLGWKENEMIRWASTLPKPAARVYMDMGTRESGAMQDDDANGVDDAVDDLRALRDVMLQQGFVLDQDLVVVEDEGAKHHETFWAARFPEALRFLFPSRR